MGEYSDVLRSHTQLAARKSYSEGLLQNIRSRLSTRPSCCTGTICVYAAGSLARHETGRASDLDVFLIGHQDSTDPKGRSTSRLQELTIFADLIRLNEELSFEPFSGDGQYLKVHELKDLITGTGTSNDDSENLFTCRLLLLLESRPIVGDAVYDYAVKEVLDMYFRDGRGRKDFRPLFILNDILRYWRTLCLNYERSRTSAGKPWWKRNLNLKFPRKITIFSTVLSIIVDRAISAENFEALTKLTPLERLARSLDQMQDPSFIAEFSQVLDDYEEFLAAKSHRELEVIEPGSPDVQNFSQKAERLDNFLHKIFASKNLDQNLVRYVLI